MNAENLKTIISVIRKTTKAIKLFPFLYAVIFIICYTFVALGNYETADTISGYTFLSPLVIAFLIYLSYAVKLCKWHRLQCLLPLLPQAVVFCDYYIYELGEALATINFIVVLTVFSFSLVNAYFVFIKPVRKKSSNLNAKFL